MVILVFVWTNFTDYKKIRLDTLSTNAKLGLVGGRF